MYDFDIRKDYMLEDDCVLLRPLTIEDTANLQYFSLHEPDIWKYSLQGADGLENLQRYVGLALQGRQAGTEYPFIVFDKRTNEYAGSTRFYDIQPALQTMQLGYTWYGNKFQRTGLNRHCKFLLFEFAFEKIGLERLELRADNDNLKSITAMKSIGLKVDGILRSNMPRPQHLPGRRDSIVLSVLKEEWFNEVKPLLLLKLQHKSATQE